MILGPALRWLGRAILVVLAAALLSWPFFWPPEAQRGVWQARAAPLVLEIGRFTVTGHQAIGPYCQRSFRLPAHRLVLSQLAGTRFEAQADGLSIHRNGRLGMTRADPVDTLPEPCRDGGTGGIEDVLPMAWTALDSYAVAAEAPVLRWGTRRPAGGQLLDSDGLWQQLEQMLDGLDDPRAYLVDPLTGRVFRPSPPPAWQAEIAAFREVLRRDGLQQVRDTGLEYALLDGNIGYVFLRHTDTRPGLGTAPEVMARIGFAELAEALGQTRAIIIDNRLNPGGSDPVALAYAGFFLPEPTDIFTRTPLSGGRSETARTGGGPGLTQPVYLLNSAFTRSAGEVLAHALAAGPDTTILGETTAGALSEALDITLPNAWRIGFSHQRHASPTGQPLDGTGLAPDIALPFDSDALHGGDDPQLRAVLELIEGG